MNKIDPTGPLTRREQEVCDLLERGLSSKDIGLALNMSRRTAEDHRANIFKKLGVKNAVELVRKIHGLEMTT